MKYIIVTALVLTVAFLSGCKSAGLKAFEDEVRADIECKHNPLAQIPKIREYALEKLNDETEEERKIILTTMPTISSNYDGSEYAYLWKIEDGMFVEVLTTPAPFTPFQVFRTRRKLYR